MCPFLHDPSSREDERKPVMRGASPSGAEYEWSRRLCQCAGWDGRKTGGWRFERGAEGEVFQHFQHHLLS